MRRLRYFYPRPPGGGRPLAGIVKTNQMSISIHALRVEGDDQPGPYGRCEFYFYPRPPGGGRPIAGIFERVDLIISIHALRVEGDSALQCTSAVALGISIHALRVEGDRKFDGKIAVE